MQPATSSAFPRLASTSMQQGRHAACHAFGHPDRTDTELLPYGIYAIPEISMVGRNEEELAKAEIPYAVGIAHYREIARGQLIGDETGMLKLCFTAIPASPRCPCHRRRGNGAHPHRASRHGLPGQDRLLHRHGLQLSDPRRML